MDCSPEYQEMPDHLKALSDSMPLARMKLIFEVWDEAGKVKNYQPGKVMPLDAFIAHTRYLANPAAIIEHPERVCEKLREIIFEAAKHVAADAPEGFVRVIQQSRRDCGEYIDPGQQQSLKLEAPLPLGGEDFTYSQRQSYLRCEYVCGGFTGLHPSGKRATWSPGRVKIPEEDEAFGPALMNGLSKYGDWPDMGNGYYHSLSPHKMYITCGNCQLICHPDKAVRKARYQRLTQSGVVVQYPDGSRQAVSPEEAEAHLADMDDDRRALYE